MAGGAGGLVYARVKEGGALDAAKPVLEGLSGEQQAALVHQFEVRSCAACVQRCGAAPPASPALHLNPAHLLHAPGLFVPHCALLSLSLQAQPGDLLLIAAGPASRVNRALDRVRQYLGQDLGLIQVSRSGGREVAKYILQLCIRLGSLRDGPAACLPALATAA